MTTANENFIMLPTVDFCFKELMQNDKVRKGFIAALLGKDPGEIRETTLLPTSVRQEYGDDKLGVLDEEGVTRWMRFFNGKKKEDFREMAKTDPYIEEAYSELEKLSADERKRIEYEAREKAVRDYNSLMGSELRRGRELGIEQGKNEKLLEQIKKKLKKGKTYAQIAEDLEEEESVIAELAGKCC